MYDHVVLRVHTEQTVARVLEKLPEYGDRHGEEEREERGGEAVCVFFAKAAQALAAFLAERVADYEARMAEPMVSGQELIDAGCRPGAQMKAMLDYARGLHFEGVNREAALARTLARFAGPEAAAKEGKTDA